MRTRLRQKGVGLVGWLVIIVIAIFFLMLAVRLVPMYYDSFVVSSIFSDVAEDPSIQSPSDIRSTIRKRFNINTMTQLSVDDVKIIQLGDHRYRVKFHYTKRAPFFGNLSLIGDFEEKVVVRVH